MIRADAGEAPSRSLRDGVHRSAVPNDGCRRERDDGFSLTTDDALDTDGGRFLAHLEHARRREFETAEACLRSHFDYVHPTVTGVPLKRSYKRKGTHRNAHRRVRLLAARDAVLRTAGARRRERREHERRRTGALAARLHAAALSLARAHVRAGRADEALKALNETVRVAQQDGDTGALAHAVAALCALSASSAAPVASRGVPAGTASSFALAPDDSDDGGRETSSFGEARKSTEDHRVLLQRLVVQARALKDPTLLAFADIASASARRARRRARRGRGGARAYRRRRRRGEARRIRGPGFRDGRGARSRRVRVPPATAAAARGAWSAQAPRRARRRGAVPLSDPLRATRRPPARAKGTERNGTPRTRLPPPRGLSAEALGDVATSASVAQLAGSASALAAAVWEAHGVAEPARLCALKHLRLDASKCVFRAKETPGDDASAAARLEVASVSAAAADTATALAQLARHASREHGPEAAADVLDMASRRFPGSGMSEFVGPRRIRRTESSRLRRRPPRRRRRRRRRRARPASRVSSRSSRTTRRPRAPPRSRRSRPRCRAGTRRRAWRRSARKRTSSSSPPATASARTTTLFGAPRRRGPLASPAPWERASRRRWTWRTRFCARARTRRRCRTRSLPSTSPPSRASTARARRRRRRRRVPPRPRRRRRRRVCGGGGGGAGRTPWAF